MKESKSMPHDDSRIEAFLQQCTEGLKSDPELCLDARRELRSHLEAHWLENHAEEDPVDAALKAMGSPLEIAEPLQKENTARMKIRALVHLGIRAALIPGAILLTVWLTWNAVEKANALISMSDSDSVVDWSTKRSHRLSKEERLILYGDGEQEEPSARLKATVDAYPEDPVYFANYVLRVVSDESGTDEELASLLEKGREIDPDNALYQCLAAWINNRKAFDTEYDENGIRVNMRDTKAAERFQIAVRRAVDLPVLDGYESELMRRRYEVIAGLDPDSVEGRMEQFAAAVGTSGPFSVCVREVIKSALGYADELKVTGREDSALELIADALVLFEVYCKSSGNTLIDWVSVMAVANLIEAEVPRLMSGLTFEQSDEERFARIAEVSRAVSANLNDRREVPFLEEIPMHGGLFAMQATGLATGLIWDPGFRFDLEPSRWLDYILLERLSLIVFLMLLLLLIGFCFVRYLWNRKCASSDSVSYRSIPLLLVPSAGSIAVTLCLSVLVPVLIYFLYSRWSLVSGRDFNASSQLWRFVSEQVVLWCIMIGTAGWLTRRFVNLRFHNLGISPADNRAFYKGSLMRSAVPVLCGMAVFTGILVHPYLRLKESDFLNADTMMSVDPAGGFSQFESKMVDTIRDTIFAKGD